MFTRLEQFEAAEQLNKIYHNHETFIERVLLIYQNVNKKQNNKESLHFEQDSSLHTINYKMITIKLERF